MNLSEEAEHWKEAQGTKQRERVSELLMCLRRLALPLNSQLDAWLLETGELAVPAVFILYVLAM